MSLFLRRVVLDREKIGNFRFYPFSINLIKNFKELTFDSSVTFFIGENGVGKSTFIEALAIALGLNPEGGTQNFSFSTRNTHSELYNYLSIYKTYRRPETKFFFRAEGFYNLASEVDNLGVGGYGRNSLHECSHGESFIQLIQNRFTKNGLYILDEPEAALSPSRQMTLLCLIDNLVKHGSQFIIATHSPILISYRDGKIFDLNNNFNLVEYKNTSVYKTFKMYLDNPEGMQKMLFDE